MKSSLSISIAMATLNGENFLGEQLASLARQSRLPDELVVTDDGSTDHTLEILQEFKGTAPFPVRIYRNEARLGFADNFLKAASVCKGDLIAFCDHDDVWHEDKLALCLREFDQPRVQLVAHATAEVDADLKLIGYLPAVKNSLAIRQGCGNHKLPWIFGCAEVVRKEVVQELIKRWPTDHREQARNFGGKLLGHDQMAFLVANTMGDIKFLAKPLVQHRCHGTNVTTSLPTLGRQVKFASAVGREAYQQQARLLQAQARLIARIAANTGDPRVTEGLRCKAKVFDRAAISVRARARIYNQHSILRRIRLIVEAGCRGYYKPQLGLHGVRSIAKDVAAAFVSR